MDYLAHETHTHSQRQVLFTERVSGCEYCVKLMIVVFLRFRSDGVHPAAPGLAVDSAHCCGRSVGYLNKRNWVKPYRWTNECFDDALIAVFSFTAWDWMSKDWAVRSDLLGRLVLDNVRHDFSSERKVVGLSLHKQRCRETTENQWDTEFLLRFSTCFKQLWVMAGAAGVSGAPKK